MSGQPIEYTLTASAETVAGLADALKRLERQNVADHKGFVESRRSIVAQRDGLAEALKASQDANALQAHRLERVRRVAEADRLGLRTYGITRDAIFAALSSTP